MIALALLLLARPGQSDSVADALRQQVVATSHPAMRWGDISDVTTALTAAYQAREWSPLWSVRGRPTSAALRMTRDLDSAAARGLDPDDFDAAWIHTRVTQPGRMPLSDIAEFDVVLSASTARFAIAISRGRIDPRVLHPGFAPRNPLDAGAALLAMAAAQRPDSVLRALEPRDVQYRVLIEWLADYRTLLARATSEEARDSLERRVRQLGITLERRRWLPEDEVRPMIVVNVPAYQLYTIGARDNAAAELHSMDVVVGRAIGHETPQLTTQLVAVTFQPDWVVPSSIAEREIRPAAMRRPQFLEEHHYELFRGDSVVPSTLSNAARIGHGIDVRQLAGPWNALGRVKFVMPNNADIYLHDTPERVLFDRDRRDFSHGCVRVADPQALAEFVLQGEPGWSRERIAAALEGDSSFTVRLTHPMPVYIIYQTLLPTEFADVVVYEDVYGEDARLEAALRRGYPYPAMSGPR